MIPLFLTLTFANLLLLAGTAALGYGVSAGKDWSAAHQLAGVLATLACCGVHCVVFTYFMATSKWAQHAVTVKRLDPDIARPTRSFRARAFPAALVAMALVCLTAFAGAITFSYRIRPIWHHALAVATLAGNVVVAAIEYRAIVRNGRLIDAILERVGSSGTDAAIV